jgi:putative nucleotidyltransferase with HDIG domain
MNSCVIKDGDKLEGYLAGIEHLPAAPTILTRLIQLFRKPDSDLDEVVTLMREDPSLTAQVLRRCNSCIFGSDNPVFDVGDAVFRLGFYEIYRMSVNLYGLNLISKAKLPNENLAEQLWRHSATAGVIAGTLARQLGECEGTAFTAGLLHDVGRIVLASDQHGNYGTLVDEHGMFGSSLNQAELAVHGFTHATLGYRLLRHWGVPEQVATPVLCHHGSSWMDEHGRLGAIVSLANVMAHDLDEGGPGETWKPEAEVPAVTALALSETDLSSLELEVQTDLQKSLSFLVGGVAELAQP